MPALVDIDFRDPAVIRDPYPHYARLRRDDPVHRSALGFWLLTRHAHVEQSLHDPRLGRAGLTNGMRRRFGDGPVVEVLGRALNFLDPPEHRRLRSMASRAFTRSVIQRARPRIALHAQRLLDGIVGCGAVDFVDAFAYPFPVHVISDILGVPEADRPSLMRAAKEVSAAADPVVSPETAQRASASVAAIAAYFRDLAAVRRQRPEDDVLSELALATTTTGDTLSESEVVSMVVLLFGAGHETTKSLIASGTVALAQFPDQLELIRGDPSLLPSAVNEMLRYDAPTQIVGRIANQAITLEGRLVGPGENVVLAVGAANRDPDRFPEADRFDVTRGDPGVTFGAGIHFCLGAELARTEAVTAFSALIERVRRVQLEDVVWRRTFVMRSPESVRVVLDAC
jgi:cytochrome P450